MSQYSAQVGAQRSGRALSVTSVGDTIDTSQLYSSSHPLYKEYSEQLRKNLAAVIARESEKQSKAKQGVVTVSLPVEEREKVVRDYPEFRIVWPQWAVPVHSTWVANRQMVNQYMTHHLSSYSSSFVHYGGSALAYLTAGVTDVTLRVNTTSAVAVHDSFDDDVACGKLNASAASAATGLGWIVNPDHLKDYADSLILVKDHSMRRSTAVADALIVDGSLSDISPLQFAAAMVQHHSEVGMFCLPYHPSMIVRPEGLLPGTDVYYELDEFSVKFKYPQGLSGVASYSVSVWHQWLVNTTRAIDGIEGFSFQFELIGSRGPFMLIRVVRVQGLPPQDTTVVHSLQLEETGDMTLVKTWKLKSLVDNVADVSSWEEVYVTVPTRVVQKTHDYAMALEADQFSRHAIRKRLAVTNDRVVVQGTSVEVHDAMASDDLDVLEIALFTHCFVARYQSGRLAAELRRVLDDVAGFAALGFAARLSHVVATCATLAYDWTIGAVDDALRTAFDKARRWLGGLPKVKGNTFQPAPQFIRYETLVSVKGKGVIDMVSALIRPYISRYEVNFSMPGYEYLSCLNAIDDRPLAGVPSIDSDYVVSRNGVEVFSDIEDTSVAAKHTDSSFELWSRIRQLNEVDLDAHNRHFMNVYQNVAADHPSDIRRDDYQYDPGYITTLSDFHESVFPGMRNVDFKYDPASISVDDQDRSLAAEYLELPLKLSELPSTMQVYPSWLDAYDTTKRPMTAQETLSAMHARNLSAPVLALPQNDEILINSIFEDFLEVACVPGAREILAKYQTDPVSLEEQGMLDWSSKVRPGISEKVLKYLLDNPLATEELKVWMYESMIKTDVKPPLSDKPLLSRVEPQLIVHHIGVVNAIYSSIFRVLVRRFLSLLKPNFMLNLLKDMFQVRETMQTHHDWQAHEEGRISFLENDFSKYDKSQGQFVHKLEIFMFEQLGMNANLLQQWKLGHINCNIRSVTTGISLHVRFQRKSGDATTAFGNGMLNLMSVVHVYKGSDIVWAVFMGDDSLVAVRKILAPELSVRALGEKFNLQAKFYITTKGYFSSYIILFKVSEREVIPVPDPIKRIQKWSMAVNAVDPKWHERFISAVSSCGVYKQRNNLVGLPEALMERYGATDRLDYVALGDAIASAIRSEEDFCNMWKSDAVALKF